MRYDKLNPNLFIENRKKLGSKLQPGSLAVINSNDTMPTNGDGTMPFVQNSDLIYLCGISQEETILLLFPTCENQEHREILFIKRTDEATKVWDGEKLSKDEASAISGVKTVLWLDDFQSVFHNLMLEAENVYLNSSEHMRHIATVESREARFIKSCQSQYPLHSYKRLAQLMHQLRVIKSQHEIDTIKKACSITEKGYKRVLKTIQPGIMEYDIEAEFIHEFTRQKSRGFAYTPIVASGSNACILHYISNNKMCKDGELVLLDIGAEYAHYNADVTRTIPVSGKFTKRQTEVYQSVLSVHKQAIAMLKPGLEFNVYKENVAKLMEEELLKLGLITKDDIKKRSPNKPAYKKYFMHGVSHYLGLEVHDVGLYNNIAAGMVLTVEPGIYIPQEGIGIRLEDDILVKAEGTENLTKNIPIEINEVESCMR